MSPVTHSFLGFKTCLIYICLFFVLASFRLFVSVGHIVLMLEESCNVLKLLNRKKGGGGEALKGVGIKKAYLVFPVRPSVVLVLS